MVDGDGRGDQAALLAPVAEGVIAKKSDARVTPAGLVVEATPGQRVLGALLLSRVPSASARHHNLGTARGHAGAESHMDDAPLGLPPVRVQGGHHAGVAHLDKG